MAAVAEFLFLMVILDFESILACKRVHERPGGGVVVVVADSAHGLGRRCAYDWAIGREP